MAHARIRKMQRSLKTPAIITTPQDLFYLTGHFLIDGGFLFLSNNQAVLFGGYLEQIKGIKTDSLRNIARYVGKAKIIEVDKHISMVQMQWLKKALPKIRIKPADSPALERRLLKENIELEEIGKAYQITAKVFSQIKHALKNKQWTEKQLAQFIRIAGIKMGADDISFPTIVAAGTNAAVPHHVPTDKVLKAGESIVLDFGFKVNGYCSDFTRTVFIKSVPAKLRDMYNAAEKAYMLAMARVISGITTSEVDAAARDYLDEKGYGKYFIHSLGHGTGIDVHEAPHLSPNVNEILQERMVFSIEPGIYIPKLGGIRIEDLVYLRNDSAHYFAKVSTRLEDMIIK